MLYLDTSAVRPLIRRIESSDLRHDVSTSILTLIELIAGFQSEEDLAIRLSLASRILESGMEVDFQLAEGKVVNSFPVLQEIPTWRTEILELIRIIPLANDENARQAVIHASGLSYFYDLIMHYDALTTQRFAADLHHAMMLARENPIPALRHWTFVDQNISSLSMSFANDATVNPQHLAPEIIQRSFNGNVILYFQVANYYLDMIVRGRHPGRNDYLDLQHFAYLENERIMCSDDRLIRTIAAEVCPDRILRPGEI